MALATRGDDPTRVGLKDLRLRRLVMWPGDMHTYFDLALLAASVILFGLAGSFALALAALLLKAVLSALGGPLHQTWLIQQTSPQARATVLSISSQANSLGETVGGPIVGAVGARYSLRAAMVLSGALLAPVVALYARTLRQAREGAEEPESPAPEIAA